MSGAIGTPSGHGYFDTAAAAGGAYDPFRLQPAQPAQATQPTGPLPAFPNDAEARAGGVPDWGYYLNSSGVQQLQGM